MRALFQQYAIVNGHLGTKVSRGDYSGVWAANPPMTINYLILLDTDWSLVKSPKATQYPRLKAACDITG